MRHPRIIDSAGRAVVALLVALATVLVVPAHAGAAPAQEAPAECPDDGVDYPPTGPPPECPPPEEPPPDVEPGDVDLCVDAEGNVINAEVNADLCVQVGGVQVGRGGDGRGALPRTGASGVVGLLQVGALLVAAGAAVRYWSRRQATAEITG